MKLAFIGLGQAGGKIVDEFLRYDADTGTGFVESAIAVNTAKTDLRGLNYIPEGNRILIGQSRVKGHGVGADNELAAEIAQDNTDEIQGALDSVPVHEIDGFLIVAGLGGGTGSGVGPVLARELKRIYTEPVYGLGILPASDEGGIYTMNAARSLQTYVRETDNLLLFDNDAWRETGESMQGGFEALNDELVRRFGVLFSAGELTAGDTIAESVVDSSEIINTLAGGGISTIGYASATLDDQSSGLLSKFREDEEAEFDTADTTNRITSLVRQAVLGRLTLPCDTGSVERALVIVSGPPEYLNRKGIERARKWVEEETNSLEVRGGDYPLPTEEQIAAVVLLSGVRNAPRIESLKQRAVETQDRIEEQQAEHEDSLDELVESEELDSLF